jgi:glycosyltransferase involved in cell wall biosynthesis
MKIVAVIPVYNEQDMIGQVVKDTRKYCDEIIVVDDGSTDRTLEIVRGLDVGYISYIKNQGAGFATRLGIERAKQLDADVVITLDGDGQHIPGYIPPLIANIVEEYTDMVVGSRFLIKPQNIGRYRRFGIGVITWLYNFGARRKISDSQCCLRAFRIKALDNIKIEENGFGFSTEMLIKARKAGYKIAEVPVVCAYHENLKENSTLNPIKHGIKVAWDTIKWRIKLWD